MAPQADGRNTVVAGSGQSETKRRHLDGRLRIYPGTPTRN